MHGLNLRSRNAEAETLRRCRAFATKCAVQIACYPDSSQPNTSFPILIRNSPTSKIPALPLSSEPRPSFNDGIIVSGRRGTVGKGTMSPADAEAVGGVGSGDSDWGGRSRSTQAKDAWNRGCS
jgi:hypothetical protein